MSDGTFLLSISGQIEFVELMSTAGSCYHCKYEFFTGPDWKIIGGLETGISQIANVISNNDKVVFNFPVDAQFKSTNLFGWPQMVLSIYKETTLEGYGRVHLPIKPGRRHLEVNLAKPQASSLLGYIGSFFGYQPELLQPKMLASTAGNNLIRMETSGRAHMSFNVISQGLLRLGYDLGQTNRE
ncbi:unnamed protein product [Ceutorhynchus assimilis]|uniref:B9 domain-containing protein 1 n=1 Tax=Ceutorhynchus assimilis TaxID=467358 RepID=A0A9N9N2H3_9CUCU|nr:unnamed protein product [Ceutorhynchus assimilis]